MLNFSGLQETTVPSVYPACSVRVYSPFSLPDRTNSEGIARRSDDGWDPGDRLRILQYKNSEPVPRIRYGRSSKECFKGSEKAASRVQSVR